MEEVVATTTKPRRYDADVKANAVARARLGQETISEIAADIGISPSTLRNWVKQAPEAAAPATLKEGPPIERLVDPNGCRVCGRTPTAEVTFRSVAGMVFMFTRQTHKGRFCRDCGRAVGRGVMDRTLVRGWWGFLSFFFNWFALFTNLVAFRHLTELGAPHGDADAAPMPAGKPMWKRFGIYVTAVMLMVFAALALASDETKSEDFAGKCVSFSADRTHVRTVASCRDGHDGKVVSVVPRGADCPAFAEGSVSLKAETDKDMCIDLDQ
jgi:transposase-like protein